MKKQAHKQVSVTLTHKVAVVLGAWTSQSRKKLHCKGFS